MDLQEILALYDQQQRNEIEYPGIKKEVLPGIVRFTRPAPGANFILYSHLDEKTADAEIQKQIAYFSQFDQPFEWDVLDHDTPSDLLARLVSAGFQPDEPGALMALNLADAPPGLLAPIKADIRQITNIEQLDDVIRVEEQVWGRNFDWLKKRMSGHLAIPGYINIYVAYVNEQPVCAGWVYFHPKSQFADLYGGSTLVEYRQHGLYTAVLARRVQDAIQRGYRFLTINASPMSRRIVANHGFLLLTYSHDCEWKNRPPEEIISK
jgi:hypothetical protein